LTGIRIVTDSACDLLDETLEEWRISMVPLRIRFGDEEFVDRYELSTKDFWYRCSTSRVLPSTAAPSPGQFQQVFEEIADEGATGIVCINLSSKMSATIESARQGAVALAGRLPIRIVDSMTVTLGIGLVATEAARIAASGATLAQVEDCALEASRSLKLYGAIDTLENLKKGGRIGGARAALGSMLAIKPVIEVRDGVVEEESKQRTRARSLRYLADKVRQAGPLRRLAVFSADAPDRDEFVGMLDQVDVSGGDILFGEVGPVVGSHAGRGAIGVAWLPQERP
jgi:DegV family protein with EDD domain